MKYRTKATGLTTQANWIGNILIAFLPPILLEAIGFNTFWVFTFTNVLGFGLSAVLPETKDKTLEEVQVMFTQWFKGAKVDPVEAEKGEDSDEELLFDSRRRTASGEGVTTPTTIGATQA